MKKSIFICLSVIIGLIGFLFTFGAAVIEPQDGNNTVEAYCLSYFGVLLPIASLEIAKFLSFKQQYKKVYVFDVVGIAICLIAIIMLNVFYVGDMDFWKIWKQEFFLYQFPWIVALLGQGLLLVLKSKKNNQRRSATSV